MAKEKKKKTTELIQSDKLSVKYPWLSVGELKTIRNGGYFDEEGALHNADGCIRCTSIVRSTGKRCRNFASVGELCCYFHGGVHGRTAAGKNRLYSAFIQDPRLKTVYETSLSNEKIQGLTDELSLLRTLLGKVIMELDEPDAEDVKTVASIIKEIRQLVGDCTNTQIKMGQLIEIGKITVIVGALSRVVSTHITDKEVLEKIAREFDNIVLPATFASTPQPVKQTPSRTIPGLPGQVC